LNETTSVSSVSPNPLLMHQLQQHCKEYCAVDLLKPKSGDERARL